MTFTSNAIKKNKVINYDKEQSKYKVNLEALTGVVTLRSEKVLRKGVELIGMLFRSKSS